LATPPGKRGKPPGDKRKGGKRVKKTKKNDGFMVVYGDFMMISLCFYGGFMVGECF